MHSLFVEFEDKSYLDIELVENNPLLEKWADIFLKNKETTMSKYLSRKGFYLYHGSRFLKNETETNKINREKAVREINAAIDDWDRKVPDYPFPYRAYIDMPWEQTNAIHRAFTTAIRSKGCFDLNASLDLLIELKYRVNIIDILRDPKFRVFKPIEKNKWSFLTYAQEEMHEILERINKWIHVYEDNSYNESISEFLPKNYQDAMYIEVEWDTYVESGNKHYHIERIPEDFKKYCDYDYQNIDVYICKNITGKDYIQAFQENDDPLQWDIVNMDFINGGITVDPNQFLFKWLYSDTTKRWLKDHSVPYDKKILQPPPLGKVKNKEWFKDVWPYVEYEKNSNKVTTTGTPMLNKHGNVINMEII